MRIDRKLNLVFPVDTTEHGTIWVHSTPIGRDVFRKYFDLIGQTVAAIHARGMNVIAGPNIAALMLRKMAEEAGRWEGPDGVEIGLMAEIRRLTNVLIAGPQGWTTIPYQEAIRRELFEDAAQDAVEGGICFFSSASAIHGWQRESLMAVLTISGMLSVWRAQITSSDSTEFARSLPMSNEAASSGETAEVLSARH